MNTDERRARAALARIRKYCEDDLEFKEYYLDDPLGTLTILMAAARESDRAAGLALVPEEAMEEMDLAMCEADHCDWSDSRAGDQSDSVKDIYNAAIAAGRQDGE